MKPLFQDQQQERSLRTPTRTQVLPSSEGIKVKDDNIENVKSIYWSPK
ncbi:hypothetical protein [Chitinophaga skermanii]|nr:hypothetical protein [Chitinophaga skermanii]